MRIFICALAVFVILCTFVALNARAVCTRADEMISAIENLPKEPDADLSGDIINLWFEYEDIFNLTVNHTVTDQIEVAIYNLHNAHDEHSLRSAKDALLVMIRDMKNSSSLALNRII